MEYIEIDETASTNSYLERNFASYPDMTMVIARRQTSGRGQRGNSWEAEEGKNLTFSLLHYPDRLPANTQFAMSEAVALAIVETLAACDIDAKVKWPNDIYCGDRKICGILIEHSVMGMEINRSIIGVGLNVNQTEFVSDAPNPVSMAMLKATEFDLSTLVEMVGMRIETALKAIGSEEGRQLKHQEFIHNLWRGDGLLYPFRDKESGATYLGRVCGVEPAGWLHVEEENGSSHRYAFKEVEFVINNPKDCKDTTE